MTVKIGVFNREEAVLEAVRIIRESGAEREELRIVVDNKENAPLLAANSEVPVEEIHGILADRRRYGDGSDVVIPVAPVGTTTGFPGGIGAVPGGAPGPIAAVPIFAADGRGPDREQVMQEIGIPDGAAEACSEAVEAGNYLLVAEFAEESELDAELLLHNAGAARVLH